MVAKLLTEIGIEIDHGRRAEQPRQRHGIEGGLLNGVDGDEGAAQQQADHDAEQEKVVEQLWTREADRDALDQRQPHGPVQDEPRQAHRLAER
jgi:hypothetical protein